MAEQDCLRKMLEWSIEIDRGWHWKPGNYGRGLMKALDAETRRELIDSYAGGNMDDLWDSLFRTAALFRKSAIRVGEHLGYAYLHDLDARVMAYHHVVKSLDRQTGSHTELEAHAPQAIWIIEAEATASLAWLVERGFISRLEVAL